MITDVLPASSSAFLRATCVVRLVVTAVQPGPWEQLGEVLSRRQVEVGARVEEVFKGEAKVGEKLVLHLEQHRNDSIVYMPVPGLWSERKLERGLEYLVLGEGGSTAQALTGPLLVLGKESAIEARLIAHAEEKHLAAPAVVEQAKAAAKSLDFAYAQWLWARHGSRAMVDPRAAEAVLSLIELPGLQPAARVTLIVEAVSAASGAPDTSLVGARRLTRALLHLLALEEALPIAENAVSLDLPNLLRLHSLPPVLRSSVLGDAEREEARKLLAAWKGKADKSVLEAWLAGP